MCTTQNKTAPEAGTSMGGNKKNSIDDYIQNIIGCQDYSELQIIKHILGVQLALNNRGINVDFYDYPHTGIITCQLVGKDVYRSVDVKRTGNTWADRHNALSKAVGGIEL